MGFRIGDKVVHPSHGAGTISGIETHSINADAAHSYYVISLMSAGSRRVMVPVDNVSMVGLRSAMVRSKANEVLEILDGRPQPLSNNFTERQGVLSKCLRSGDPKIWAELARNLYCRGLKKKLSTTDQDYYNRSRDMLAGEIALADNCTIEAASKRIEDRLRAKFGLPE